MSVKLAIGTLAALCLWTAEAGSHGSNPYHLDTMILNPFAGTGRIDAVATDPTHKNWWAGDLSIDVAPVDGVAAGTPVIFKATARTPNTSVRGKILSGGNDRLKVVCWTGLPSSGGYFVKLAIEVKQGTGSWQSIGWVVYAHVDANVAYPNNTYLYDGMPFATVTGMFANGCSTYPHLHVEFYDYNHYAGYVPRAEGSTFPADGTLACVGGSRPPGVPC